MSVVSKVDDSTTETKELLVYNPGIAPLTKIWPSVQAVEDFARFRPQYAFFLLDEALAIVKFLFEKVAASNPAVPSETTPEAWNFEYLKDVFGQALPFLTKCATAVAAADVEATDDMEQWASQPLRNNLIALNDATDLENPETLNTIIADACPDVS